MYWQQMHAFSGKRGDIVADFANIKLATNKNYKNKINGIASGFKIINNWLSIISISSSWRT